MQFQQITITIAEVSPIIRNPRIKAFLVSDFSSPSFVEVFEFSNSCSKIDNLLLHIVQ